MDMTSNRHSAQALRIAALMATCAALASCGGGGGDPGGPAPAPTPGLNDATRTAAATATAQSATNACAALPSFYWEIGDRAARIASGSVKAPGALVTYTSSMQLNIASASKWLFGAYVVQKRSGSPTAQDIKHLTFQSGYTNFDQCARTDTVGSCLATGSNGSYTAANDGKFFYNGGHMQKLASLMGLDGLDNASLAFELQGQIGTEIALSYTQPQPAGGVKTSADEYAKFLRKLLTGDLMMASALGTHPVCTNRGTCSSAVFTPVPSTESWHYSLGHWVEDDPAVGDGAFSSPGAFGFYPWVDASKTYYGILAREDLLGTGMGAESAKCGRLIRKAWMTGVSY